MWLGSTSCLAPYFKVKIMENGLQLLGCLLVGLYPMAAGEAQGIRVFFETIAHSFFCNPRVKTEIGLSVAIEKIELQGQ
jgi:hypothetical protein